MYWIYLWDIKRKLQLYLFFVYFLFLFKNFNELTLPDSRLYEVPIIDVDTLFRIEYLYILLNNYMSEINLFDSRLKDLIKNNN